MYTHTGSVGVGGGGVVSGSFKGAVALFTRALQGLCVSSLAVQASGCWVSGVGLWALR